MIFRWNCTWFGRKKITLSHYDQWIKQCFIFIKKMAFFGGKMWTIIYFLCPLLIIHCLPFSSTPLLIIHSLFTINDSKHHILLTHFIHISYFIIKIIYKNKTHISLTFSTYFPLHFLKHVPKPKLTIIKGKSEYCTLSHKWLEFFIMR